MTREYTARETRWVTEYVMHKYPDDLTNGRVAFQVSLGPLAAGLTMRAAPRADAVIIKADLIIIIEADAENITSAIGQLEFYQSMFFLTPRFKDLPHREVKGVLLLETFDTTLAAFAASRGIEVDTWAPAWLTAYLIEKRGRKR